MWLRRSVLPWCSALLVAACERESTSLLQRTPLLSVDPTALTCVPGISVPVRVLEDGSTPRAAVTVAVSGTPGTAAASVAAPNAVVVQCLQAGRATVTVTIGNQQVGVPVTVTAPLVAGLSPIVIAPVSSTLAVRDTVRLRLTAGGAASVETRWTSSHPAIAVVDALSGLVRGVEPGVATIIGRPADRPALAAAAQVTVVARSGP